MNPGMEYEPFFRSFLESVSVRKTTSMFSSRRRFLSSISLVISPQRIFHVAHFWIWLFLFCWDMFEIGLLFEDYMKVHNLGLGEIEGLKYMFDLFITFSYLKIFWTWSKFELKHLFSFYNKPCQKNLSKISWGSQIFSKPLLVGNQEGG